MSKANIVEHMAKQTGLTKADSERAFNAMLEAIVKFTKKEGSTTIVGFGSFKKTKRKARMGVNPSTGAKIKIAASTRLTFKSSKSVKM